MMAKGRHKPHLNPKRGEACHCSKLTESDVASIRRRYSEGGETYVSLGAEFSVHFQTIIDVVKRHTWKHVA